MVTCSILCFAAAAAQDTALDTHYDYCVIGGGPGGIQAAVYLEQLAMKYVVFERNPRAGSFFERYPRHRRLISINKRYTGKADAEFQLRHDWNSLISHFDAATAYDVPKPFNSTWLFPPYSSAYFPKASLLVDYLNDIIDRYGLNVYRRHAVTSVRRLKDSPTAPFILAVEPPHDTTKEVRCRVLFLATGRFVPLKLRDDVEEHIEGYESVSSDPRDYRNQDVLILGAGNGGLETADAIHAEAASVHVASRYPVTIGWQTHYVGHARALNFGLFDRDQFSMLDALISGQDFGGLEIVRYQKLPRKIVVRITREMLNGTRQTTLEGTYNRIVRCLGFLWDQSIFTASDSCATPVSCDTTSTTGCIDENSCGTGGQPTNTVPILPFSEPKKLYLEVASNFESVNVPRLFVVGTLMHYRDFKKTAGGFIHGFRYLVRTLILQLRERFHRTPYPSLDLGPFASFDAAVDAAVSLITARQLNASSLYQFPGHLGDILMWDLSSEQPRLRFIRDIPIDQATSRNVALAGCEHLRQSTSFLFMTLEFGKQFEGMGVLHHVGQPAPEWRRLEKQLWDDATDPDMRIRRNDLGPTTARIRPSNISVRYPPFNSNNLYNKEQDDYSEVPLSPGFQFIHPVFRLFSRTGVAEGSAPRKVMEFGLEEDLHNEWCLPRKHIAPLRRFLRSALKKMRQP